jgi:SagB-type dehydrogenase family enzyme
MDEIDLVKYIRRADARPSDTDEMEVFHESTKYFRSVMQGRGLRVSAYLNSERTALETAFNYKSYFPYRELELPAPQPSAMSAAAALMQRRTCRRFSSRAISMVQLSSLLQLSAGITAMGVPKGRRGLPIAYRSAPSAGNLSPIEIYMLALEIDGLAPAVSHYAPRTHSLDLFPQALDHSAWKRALADDEDYLSCCSACLLITAVLPRTTVKYGSRGYRFAILEGGAVMMNVSLVAETLGLGSVIVGGFFDDEVHQLLDLDGIEEVCLGVIFVGVPASSAGVTR